MGQTGRDRAHLVCMQCHARKVRCDLQESSTGSCGNCQRYNQQCVPRDGLRKRRTPVRPRSLISSPSSTRPDTSATADSQAVNNSSSVSLLSPAQSAGVEAIERSHSGALYYTASPDFRRETGYIAHSSVLLSHDTPAQSTVSYELSRGSQSHLTKVILEATQADVLPKQPLRLALTEALFTHLGHVYPIVDRKDVDGPGASILLQQAACLAGSLMRHGMPAQSIQLSHDLYQKVKTLIYINYETCSLAVLKAMCLLSTWSPNPSDSTSLDGPWQWSGSAIRVALQLGLHRQSTVADREDAGSRKRIWWHLYCSDRLQSACFGRPLMIRHDDFDVAPLTIQDFVSPDISASVFMHSVSMCTIIGRISELSRQTGLVHPEEISSVHASLCDWLQLLPEDLRIYDSVGQRRPYVRSVIDMHQLYFVAIILLQALTNDHNRHWRTSIASLVASSCIARLYEEMYHREDVVYLLHISIFACMVAAVPQIYYKPHGREREECRQDELSILRSVVEVLRCKFGGADTVLRNMDALERDLGRRGHLRNAQTDEFEGDELNAINIPERTTELFPFPTSLCPNMELLLVDQPAEGGLYLDNFLPIGDGLPEWIFTQSQPFLNILEADQIII